MTIKTPWQIRRERDYWIRRAAALWAENRGLRRPPPGNVTLGATLPGAPPAPDNVGSTMILGYPLTMTLHVNGEDIRIDDCLAWDTNMATLALNVERVISRVQCAQRHAA